MSRTSTIKRLYQKMVDAHKKGKIGPMREAFAGFNGQVHQQLRLLRFVQNITRGENTYIGGAPLMLDAKKVLDAANRMQATQRTGRAVPIGAPSINALVKQHQRAVNKLKAAQSEVERTKKALIRHLQ